MAKRTHRTEHISGSPGASPLHSEAMPPDLQAHLVTFLRSFLEEELPDVIAGVVRDEIDTLRQDLADDKHEMLEHKRAARRLGISPRKLDQLVAAGDVRPLRIGRKRVYPSAQLEAFLRRCR
ncbi:MAG: helix-turn-helix domain-containing protein [Rhodothermales bacterium]